MLFSQREGLKPAKKSLQVNSMDDELRSSLWNALVTYYWFNVQDYDLSSTANSNMIMLIIDIYKSYFKKPIDSMSNSWAEINKQIREHFFNCDWNEVYDFIEFVGNNNVANNENNLIRNAVFIVYCNKVLERESSAYRFVDGKIAPITTLEEIGEIESAVKETGKRTLEPVQLHLKKALAELANRRNPDYHRSIGESIIAVESLSKLMAGNPDDTFEQALEIIETNIGFPNSLKEAFAKLFGYRDDSKGGIQHPLMETPNFGIEDAKLILVASSAFINYLIAKAPKVGIHLH